MRSSVNNRAEYLEVCAQHLSNRQLSWWAFQRTNFWATQHLGMWSSYSCIHFSLGLSYFISHLAALWIFYPVEHSKQWKLFKAELKVFQCKYFSQIETYAASLLKQFITIWAETVHKRFWWIADTLCSALPLIIAAALDTK